MRILHAIEFKQTRFNKTRALGQDDKSMQRYENGVLRAEGKNKDSK